ncbi:hypothetical protein RB2654_14970 [Rhodobacterales bacterium HTCC2654]|uniref:Uncharacterized protein n=1 Tax=Maritimibacter alkaliphilus HTCC2654 TaxID=314271 RepID=A3VH43_9RHOB|nr:hypothetical protein RB2654_14970 [Rhodobacterales bacterium HTCC2654] [Maritimibacter alkaliphilus HTCC2654]
MFCRGFGRSSGFYHSVKSRLAQANPRSSTAH